MKRMLLCFVMIFIVALNVFSNGEAPDWYQSGVLLAYPKDLNFIGIGQGKTTEEATSEALSMIAGQFSVNITSTIELFKKETNYNGQVSMVDSFTSETSMYVNEFIEGAEIVKLENTGNNWFAFAALNKKEYATLILNDLNKNQTQIDKYTRDAKEKLNSGDILGALQDYVSSYLLAKQNFTKTRYLDILRVDFGFNRLTSVADIITKVTEIIYNLNIEVSSKPQESAIPGSYFKEPFILHVQYDSGLLSIPAKNIPVVVRDENGIALARLLTDIDGDAALSIQAIPSAQNTAKGSFTASVNLSQILGDIAIFIPPREANVEYDLNAASDTNSFSVSIKDGGNTRSKNIENIFTNELNAIGVNVDQKNPAWEIRGVISITDENQVTTFRGTQFIVSVELNLELINIATEDTVNQKLLRSTGVSTKNRDDAYNRATQLIKVNSRFLTSFVKIALQ